MKLVKEYINFERGLDPKVAMGTGDLATRIKNTIVKALKNLPVKNPAQVEISDLNPEFTEVEINYKDRTFFIGATWPRDKKYNYYVQVIMKNGDAFTEDDTYTLEECIEILKGWLKRVNTLP